MWKKERHTKEDTTQGKNLAAMMDMQRDMKKVMTKASKPDTMRDTKKDMKTACYGYSRHMITRGVSGKM